MNKTKKILFVAMQNSPHACRWINSIADRGWDLHLFPIDANPPLQMLKHVTVHPPIPQVSLRRAVKTFVSNFFKPGERAKDSEPSYEPIFKIPLPGKIASALGQFSTLLEPSKTVIPSLYGPQVLAKLIKEIKPDLIHSMEFQHCSYNVLEAKKHLNGDFPPWLATNWGSDIYYYRQFEEHRLHIEELLSNIDYYSCECQRDVSLARELGMTAKVMPVMPNTGGFDLDYIHPLRTMLAPSKRKLVMIKGYQHFAGRVLIALQALEHCADIAKEFHVVIFSPSREAISRAKELRTYTDIKHITILPWAPHDQMLRMFSRARVYLGVSASDAISTSALESMAMGCFPIQTNTSCCDEWFNDGEGGYIISPDDVSAIAHRLRDALSNDDLVDNAAQINWVTVKERLDQRFFSRQVWGFYDKIFE